MKVQLKFITNSIEALKEIAALNLKAKHSFQVARLIKSAQGELESYDTARIATIKKFSSDGQKVDDDKVPVFISEINELLEKEVELSDCVITEADLQDFSLKAATILQLEWLIKKE